MRALPAAPAPLDLGCGVGGQTLHLTEFTTGTITAVFKDQGGVMEVPPPPMDAPLGGRH